MKYKDFAISLAREAGDIIKKNFMRGMKKEWKSDNTPLTEADLAINSLVISSVKKAFPNHDILAEEESSLSEKSDFVWVCDPIDGTIPFSHGIPTCVFSLALTEKGEVILGVVYDPFMDRMFFAEKNKGASLNGKKIFVSTSKNLKNNVIGMSLGSQGTPYDLSSLPKELNKKGVKIVDLCSITYAGALVSSGELVATIFPYLKSHDTAALKVIVEEAGGKVTDLFGADQRYDKDIKGHLITNRLLHEELIKLIKENIKIR